MLDQNRFKKLLGGIIEGSMPDAVAIAETIADGGHPDYWGTLTKIAEKALPQVLKLNSGEAAELLSLAIALKSMDVAMEKAMKKRMLSGVRDALNQMLGDKTDDGKEESEE